MPETVTPPSLSRDDQVRLTAVRQVRLTAVSLAIQHARSWEQDIGSATLLAVADRIAKFIDEGTVPTDDTIAEDTDAP